MGKCGYVWAGVNSIDRSTRRCGQVKTWCAFVAMGLCERGIDSKATKSSHSTSSTHPRQRTSDALSCNKHTLCVHSREDGLEAFALASDPPLDWHVPCDWRIVIKISFILMAIQASIICISSGTQARLQNVAAPGWLHHTIKYDMSATRACLPALPTRTTPSVLAWLNASRTYSWSM
jgi:hypothetical protein